MPRGIARIGNDHLDRETPRTHVRLRNNPRNLGLEQLVRHGIQTQRSGHPWPKCGNELFRHRDGNLNGIGGHQFHDEFAPFDPGTVLRVLGGHVAVERGRNRVLVQLVFEQSDFGLLLGHQRSGLQDLLIARAKLQLVCRGGFQRRLFGRHRHRPNLFEFLLRGRHPPGKQRLGAHQPRAGIFLQSLGAGHRRLGLFTLRGKREFQFLQLAFAKLQLRFGRIDFQLDRHRPHLGQRRARLHPIAVVDQQIQHPALDRAANHAPPLRHHRAHKRPAFGHLALHYLGRHHQRWFRRRLGRPFRCRPHRRRKNHRNRRKEPGHDGFLPQVLSHHSLELNQKNHPKPLGAGTPAPPNDRHTSPTV